MLNAEVKFESELQSRFELHFSIQHSEFSIAMSCPICDDTGWKPVEATGVRRVVRCECWQSEHARRLFEEANPPALSALRFREFPGLSEREARQRGQRGAPVCRNVSEQL